MAMCSRDHWHCVRVALNQTDDKVDKLKIETRDNVENWMKHVASVNDVCYWNKECLDDLFHQLGMQQWQCVENIAQ